jgi:hypothetical protein
VSRSRRLDWFPAQQAGPVVLELYTSQGCSSCPPADALFAHLAQRDDVIALALHVDYWDYLGWKDAFARPRHTARQKAYAKAARSRTIFTPEMIVQGEDRVKGHDAAAISTEIAAHLRRAPRAALSVEREGDAIRIDVAPAAHDPEAPSPIGSPALAAPSSGAVPASETAGAPADIHVVRFLPEEEVSIEGGENAGQTVTYHNIVTDWQTIGQWDGASSADFVYRNAGDGPVAVIVQGARMGPILAAARVP